MRAVLKNKFENYKPREGTIQQYQDESDRADQTRAEECNIKKMIEKYGVMPFEMLNKASEQLYLNNLGESMTLTEKVKMREQIDDYFNNLPAKARKEFKDDKEVFYNSIITGQFDKMIEYGIFDEQQKELYSNQLTATTNKIKDLETQLQKERTKYNELEKQFNLQKDNTISPSTTTSMAEN